MSYLLQAYAVNIEKLQAVFGSNDLVLVKRMTKRFAMTIDQNRTWFERRISAGVPSLDQAIAQIVEGKVSRRRRYGFQYAYATELLCEQLGRRLDQEGDLSFLELLKLKTKLMKQRLPLPVPLPQLGDFPETGFLTAEEVQDELPKLKAIIENENKHKQAMARAELLCHLKRASKLRTGLVTFTY